MLAPTQQMTAAGARRAEIVVGIHSASDPGGALRLGYRVGRQLEALYPQRSAAVLVLSEVKEAIAPTVEPDVPVPAAPLLAWPHPGQSALEALLRAAETLDASACALVEAEGGRNQDDDARRLLAPVVDEGCDLVCPCYPARRFEGVLNTGIVYPLARAVFGRRLRQPMVSELAVSRRLAAHLLSESWHADPVHAGERLWLVTAAPPRDFKVCQSCLGTRAPRLADAETDLADSLAHVVGTLFHEMRLHAREWQRIKGSLPVATFGEATLPEGEAKGPQIAPMMAAFQLGLQELGRLWATVLPPQSLLGLKRLSRADEASFALDDGLWARIVYDFAVGYHLAVMDRTQLLRSMTPLYLAWAAGFVREVRDVDAAGVEARVERLCAAFEGAKPYLISRWRWPDRFNP